MARKTQIVVTVGPKTESPEMIKKLIEGGMDVARFNFSHDVHESFEKRAKLIRKYSSLRKKVKILADLQGPRIRVGDMPKEGRTLRDGEKIVFTTHVCGAIKKEEVVIRDPYLHEDVKKGDIILLDNGIMEAYVTGVHEHKIEAKILRGGTLFSNKGVNLPLTKTTTSAITDKDKKDIEFIKKMKFDYVALSFVSCKEDLELLRHLLGEGGPKIISKIETGQAIQNLHDIIELSDAIMVARGDLGIETPMEKLPLLQKEIINKTKYAGKPVITATQMLDSMVKSPHPTRAEVSDIANAIIDGTSALMLSNETAVGDYPLQALNMMAKVAEATEDYINNGKVLL
ncbi:MAG: Pyruvate kinase [bacterium ADurb.Bin212]|nr:MAG: Pyruvate kinase [bacterium ADurb.Bin212]